jgi:hypothetical protein
MIARMRRLTASLIAATVLALASSAGIVLAAPSGFKPTRAMGPIVKYAQTSIAIAGARPSDRRDRR